MERFVHATFEWDEAKRQSNLDKHEIDFLRVQELFDGRPVVIKLSSYASEERYLTTGSLGNRFVTVVWTRRIGGTRLISARGARDDEIRAYRALYEGRDR